MVRNDGDAVLETLHAQQRAHHQGCWVCDPRHPLGLAIDFRPDGVDAVAGTFECTARYRSYDGILHGGVVTALLDGAMTACLMARGDAAVTADLRVRFRRSVEIGRPVRVRAWYESTRKGIHTVSADLRQDGVVCATAIAKFMPPSASRDVTRSRPPSED